MARTVAKFLHIKHIFGFEVAVCVFELAEQQGPVIRLVVPSGEIFVPAGRAFVFRDSTWVLVPVV
jgi:hypothetical protein